MSTSITSERAARQPVPPRRSVASLRAPAAAPSASLNRLSVRWQAALTAAQDAVHAAAGGHPALAPAEAGERDRRLAQEREVVSRLLEEAARTEHVRLVRGIAARPR